jgi:hypothetical protein
MKIVTALEFAQCSMYSIRSLVVPNAFSLTIPALNRAKINVTYSQIVKTNSIRIIA